MVICGLKLTHDGAVALIDNDRLVFSVELEKVNNNARYTSIEDTAIIERILADNGYSIDQVDAFAVDGWGGYDQEALAIQPRLAVGEEFNQLTIDCEGVGHHINIAQYHERTLKHNLLQEWQFEGLPFKGKMVPYSSFLHATGHVLSAYCTSPFARQNESSYVLIWDGGMYPRLYYVDADTKHVENLGPIFLLIGNIYTIFSQHFGPFKVKGGFAKDSLSVAGKVMAYIALGKPRRELFPIFDDIYSDCYNAPMGFANVFANEFKRRIETVNVSDEDILATFHLYLEEMLVEKLAKKIGRYDKTARNLCFSGGCALNIKWNSAIRNSGVFADVYVPPFPNDSGSAIGAACAAMYHRTGRMNLNWNVYAGPQVVKNAPVEGWSERVCSIGELAELLHTTGEPVVFLNGRAELGPRALGNRSIIAPAKSPQMKGILNQVKGREMYRPVSPICLEEAAAELFSPGIKDPYMLFDHDVREGWADRIPAVCHLDNSARLQTVNADENPVVTELLTAYKAISGLPLLCNTSANYNGSGFFPDVRSVTEWGKVNYVWSDNTLYEKLQKQSFAA